MTLTGHRTIQYIGLFLILGLIAGGYWYFSVRAGVKVNTSASQSQGTGQLDAGLGLYWAFDEGSGSTTTDLSSNPYDGTEGGSGLTWVTGQIGSAMHFDGSNHYLDSDVESEAIEFEEGENFTIAAWFNRDTFTTDDAIIGRRTGTSPANEGYVVYIDDATDKVTIEVSDGTDEYMVESVSTFTSANWHHVAIVWNDATGVTMYIDGVAEAATATGTFANINSLNTGAGLRVGSIGSMFFNGTIDEVRAYTRALSREEASLLYQLRTASRPDEYLDGYWSFNSQDMLGATVPDQSGVNNTGTLIGGVMTQGRVGQAIDFDGTDDYVNIPDVQGKLDVGDTEDLTLTGWFNRDTFTTDDTIIAKRTGITAANDGYILYIDDATDKLTFEVSESGGTDEYQLESTGTFTDSGWHHYVIVWDQDSAANSEIYVDGRADNATDTGTIGNLGALDTSADIAIGAESDVGNPFDGKLDEIRVYKRTFSLSEIKAQYDVGSPDKTNTSAAQPQGTGNLDSTLTGYWKLDENTGTSAADSSTNSNAGTLTNGPTWTTGQIGSAVTFDGTDDYITVGDINQIDGASTVTISAWINQTSLSVGRAVFSKYFTGSPNIGFGSDGADNSAIGMSVDNNGSCSSSAGTHASGVWEHWVWVYDGNQTGNTNRVKGYKNGVQQSLSCAGTIPATTPSTANAAAIGADSAGDGSSEWNGAIDEVRIYDRPLSADEVADLYRLTTPTAVDASLNGYWSFNASDIFGTTAYDRSGAGNIGTLTNSPAKAIGRIGQALDFDGTDDIVSIADDASLRPGSTSFTMSIWAKPADVNQRMCIFAKRQNGSPFEQSSLAICDAASCSGSGQKFIMNAIENNTTTYRTATSVADIPDGNWHHFVGVADTSTDNVKLYVDGVEIAVTRTALGSWPTINNTDALEIGDCNASLEFDGPLDEARYYSRALSASEIKSLYDLGQSDKVNTSVSQSQGTGRLDSGLAGYWKLDEGTGTSAADSSTNASNGTLTNGPTWTTGQIGSAVTFDGTDDYITGSMSSLDAPVTICSWFKIDASSDVFDNTSEKDGIVTLRSSSTSYEAFTIGIDNNGNSSAVAYAGARDNANGIMSYANGSTNLWNRSGEWLHICGVFSNSTLRQLYLNGKLEGTNTSTENVQATTLFIGVGTTSTVLADYASGDIDEVRAYTRALSEDEIAQLYRLTTPTGTDTSLKGYWSFNGQDLSGTTVYDRSGAANNGTLTNGPTKTIGKLGQGLSFDGTDDYVAIPDISDRLDASDTDDLTLSIWFYRDTFTTDDSLLGKRAGTAAASAGYFAYIDDATDKVTFEVSDGTDEYQLESTTTFTSTGWHHLVVVFDESDAANCRIYIDGADDGATKTGTLGNVGNLAQNTDFTVGWNSSSSNWFSGKLDEARIYKRTLSASEVQNLYNQTK